MSVGLARRLFEYYQRTLLISNPVAPDQEMRESIRKFVEMFGFRIETCAGTMGILERTWEEARGSLSALTG
jgi:CO dehydrogenase/acetyl-CoA synthase epsilon subunit